MVTAAQAMAGAFGAVFMAMAGTEVESELGLCLFGCAGRHGEGQDSLRD